MIRTASLTATTALALATSSADAAACEFIDIKYRLTPVCAEDFELLATGHGSVVRNGWNDSDERYLLVNLRGTVYHYCDVPPAVPDSLVRTRSPGRFYRSEIRGCFDCRYATVPSYQ